MKRVCLVTYTRSTEGFTEELHDIAEHLSAKYGDKFKVVICCEQKIEVSLTNYQIDIFETSGTKYRRLIELMEADDSEYYISVDNDITGNIPEIMSFVDTIIASKYEVGWGRIRAKKQKKFISNMVAVDKLLSHNIIRPALWKLNVGISIPGQIFCIKGDSFRGKLLELDTFLDDLALGLYVSINNSKKYVTSSILGYEQPNGTFGGLWNQRKRWAIGFTSILKAVINTKEYRTKVIIHGLSYHFSWLINWVLAALFIVLLGPWGLLYFVVIGLLISRKDIGMLFYAIIYQLFFPIFHIRWIIVFLKEVKNGGQVCQ